MSGTDKKAERPSRPWRDNLEAITVSVIIIVLFKYFTLEAYKIPTGSMQPTLMGWTDKENGGGIFDRVLVDKLSPHYTDYDRYEIVVFKYPLNTSMSFIKRILGMPGEHLEIRNGDVWRSDGGNAPLEVLHAPRRIQDTQFKKLRTANEWKLDRTWVETDGTIVGDGPGQARFPRRSQSVRDHFSDGYPGLMVDRVKGIGKESATNAVGDLRVTCDVEPAANCDVVRVSIQEGRRTYVLEIPGPAAAADAKVKGIIADDRSDTADLTRVAESDVRFEAGSSYAILVQNINDRVTLEIDGDVVLEFDVAACPQDELRVRSGIELATSGGGGEFQDVEVSRDIYYTASSRQQSSWDIPEDCYVMLGDNTQDSSDSRDWTLVGYRMKSDPSIEIWGNQRGSENPVRTAGADGSGPMLYFRDQLGELHVLREREVESLGTKPSRFVHRSLIRGRAIVVVWPPYVPSLEVSRLQWVR
tara:strand:- start:3414 stop:4829 length:1416 start_codon:yes stop_codon:yes gene_type:complete